MTVEFLFDAKCLTTQHLVLCVVCKHPVLAVVGDSVSKKRFVGDHGLCFYAQATLYAAQLGATCSLAARFVDIQVACIRGALGIGCTFPVMRLKVFAW